MAHPQTQISFKLDGGMDDVSVPDDVTMLGSSPSPNLVVSRNTRLGKVNGVPSRCPGAEAITVDAAVTGNCGGIVPAGHVDSSVAFLLPAEGSKRISGTTASKIESPLLGGQIPSNYYPADTIAAGAVPGGPATAAPSVVSYGGYTYYASTRLIGLTVAAAYSIGVFVAVLHDDGRVICAPTLVVGLGAAASNADVYACIGLTQHGASGIRLWYVDSSVLYVRELSVSGNIVTAGAATAVYTTGNGVFAVASSGGGAHAYVAARDTATSTSVTVSMVNVVTPAVVASVTRAMGADTLFFDVAHVTHGGVSRVAVGVSTNTDVQTVMLTSTSAPTLAYNASWTSYTEIAEPTVSFLFGPTDAGYVVTTSSIYAGQWSAVGISSNVEIDIRTLAGVAVSTKTIPWARCMAKASTCFRSSDEAYTLLIVQSNYGPMNTVPLSTAENFTLDPSVDVFMISLDGQTPTRIGRYGVNTAIRGAAAIHGVSTLGLTLLVSGTSYMAPGEDTLRFTYLSDGISSDGGMMRYVTMSLAARQPRYAIDARGCAVIAAALPVYWDGAECAEFSPATIPKVQAVTGGTGINFTGAYNYIAVVAWRDSSGQLRRSPPSTAYAKTWAAEKPRIYVSVPALMRDAVNQETFTIELYATEAGGSAFYKQAPYVTAKTSTRWTFGEWPEDTVVDAAHPILYSDGSATQQLVPYCPPALHDVAFVGNRGWAIPSERRGVAIYTKEPSSENEDEGGVAPEWCADLEVRFPSSAGNLTAVADGGGFPIFLSPVGIWTVQGQGPDNLLQGVGFSAPQQIADVACTTRESVIKTPIGVMFEGNGVFYAFGGGIKSWGNIDASRYGTIVNATLFREFDEVVFWGTTGAWVYNYALDRWTTWELSGNATAAAAVPVSGDVLLFDATYSEILMVAQDSVTSYGMVLTTGDMTFGGPQDDVSVTEVVVESLYTLAANLVVSAYADHSTTPYTVVFTAASITAAQENGRYAFSVRLPSPAMRSLRLSFSDGIIDNAEEGFQPVSVTLIYGKGAGTKRLAIKDSLRK